MVEPWQVQLLGGVSLRRGEVVVARLRSLKMAALLGCLCAAPGRQFSRDELIARFWPDEPIEAGQNNLRVALSRLKTELGEGVLDISRLYVRLIPGMAQTDVAAFERAARGGNFSVALELYAGPFLPGVYDDATVAERERLEALATQVRERVERLGASSALRVALPHFLTSFFARVAEKESLSELLAHRRLVTLIGPGGIGKTRLATELAGALVSPFSVVAFVPLDECFDASQVLERVKHSLALSGEGPTQELLAAFLHERATLLVLDNLEQLIESGAADVIAELLRRVPSLRCLVTSRRPLGVPGEQLFPLPPLILEQSLTLFLDRARSVHPAFAVTEQNRGTLETLCRKLDGVPLALELAASRVRSRSLLEMLEELEHSLNLLTRPMKVARHASLHATIHWSWRLLPSHQQAFLAQLSVFRGGWTAEAASVVCDQPDAKDRLEALLDASLVVREESVGGQVRYRLLELIRTFAAEQLPYDSREVARQRHREFFSSHAEAENVLAALESAREDGDSISAYALIQAHGQGCLLLLGIPVCLEITRSVLTLPAPTPRARLMVLSQAVQLASTHGEPELADSLCQAALELAGETPGLRCVALAIQGQLAVARYADPSVAIPPLREALALVAPEDVILRANLLRRLGILLFRSHVLEEATACFEQSEQLFARQGDLTGVRYALALRADVIKAQGDLTGSLAIYQTCLRQARTEQDRLHESKLLLNISTLQAGLNCWKDSLSTERECLKLCQEIGNIRTLAFAFWNVPESFLNLGYLEAAATLMVFAERFWLTHFTALTDDDIFHRDRILAGCAAHPEALEVGQTLTLPEALALALR